MQDYAAVVVQYADWQSLFARASYCVLSHCIWQSIRWGKLHSFHGFYLIANLFL